MAEKIEGATADEGIDLDNLPAGGQPGEVPVNKAQVAEAMGWSLPTVDAKIRRGMPVAITGTNGRAYAFYLSQVKAWVEQQEALAAELAERQAAQVRDMQLAMNLTGGDAEAPVQLDPRMRNEALQAELQHIKVARLRGELCEAAAVREAMYRLVAFVADRLQSLPDYLERRAALKPEVVAMIAQAVDDWQAQLAADAQRELAPQDDRTRAGAA